MFTRVKTAKEIEWMRESGRMLGEVLKTIRKNIGVGSTTKDAAQIARRELKALGGKSAFLDYQGFPDVICTSVNHEIVHGIPNSKQLTKGDFASFDYGVNYNGMITDAAFTMVIGGDSDIDADEERLLTGTKQALYAGIDVIKDGVRVGDISAAVEKVLKKHKLGIVRELVGHGVGHQVHEEPNIPNYGQNGTGPILKAGMTIAIEPMAMLGSEEIGILPDGWTVITTDGSLSAHFEHTVLITKDGSEILTDND